MTALSNSLTREQAYTAGLVAATLMEPSWVKDPPIGGFPCGDINRGGLPEKYQREAAQQRSTLRWGQIAGWGTIVSGMLSGVAVWLAWAEFRVNGVCPASHAACFPVCFQIWSAALDRWRAATPAIYDRSNTWARGFEPPKPWWARHRAVSVPSS